MADHAALSIPAPARFNGEAAWSRLAPEQQAVIGAIALEIAANFHLMDRIYEDALPEGYARVSEAAAAELHRQLAIEAADALSEDALVAPDGRSPRIASLLGGVCRVCFCSQNDACEVGCGWAAEDLCTACVKGDAL